MASCISPKSQTREHINPGYSCNKSWTNQFWLLWKLISFTSQNSPLSPTDCYSSYSRYAIVAVSVPLPHLSQLRRPPCVPVWPAALQPEASSALQSTYGSTRSFFKSFSAFEFSVARTSCYRFGPCAFPAYPCSGTPAPRCWPRGLRAWTRRIARTVFLPHRVFVWLPFNRTLFGSRSSFWLSAALHAEGEIHTMNTAVRVRRGVGLVNRLHRSIRQAPIPRCFTFMFRGPAARR